MQVSLCNPPDPCHSKEYTGRRSLALGPLLSVDFPLQTFTVRSWSSQPPPAKATGQLPATMLALSQHTFFKKVRDKALCVCWHTCEFRQPEKKKSHTKSTFMATYNPWNVQTSLPDLFCAKCYVPQHHIDCFVNTLAS